MAAGFATRSRYKEAEPVLGEALVLAEAAFGNDSLEAQRTGGFAEATRLYSRAMAIFERPLAPSHPKVTTCGENYELLIRK